MVIKLATVGERPIYIHRPREARRGGMWIEQACHVLGCRLPTSRFTTREAPHRFLCGTPEEAPADDICTITYVHTCIHTYTHTYIHTYMHTYIQTHIHTYIHRVPNRNPLQTQGPQENYPTPLSDEFTDQK